MTDMIEFIWAQEAYTAKYGNQYLCSRAFKDYNNLSICQKLFFKLAITYLHRQ